MKKAPCVAIFQFSKSLIALARPGAALRRAQDLLEHPQRCGRRLAALLELGVAHPRRASSSAPAPLTLTPPAAATGLDGPFR
jgi:hypothetical protein